MNVQQPSFDSGRLATIIRRLPKCKHFRLGFSGGADSTALLLAMSEVSSDLGVELSALHFNHGLNPDSGKWAAHCAQFCDQLGVPLKVRALEIKESQGSGIEAEARHLRYQYVGELLRCGEAYLTAHHLEDQAETLLLNLMRASGIDGLAAIPRQRKLGRGFVLRPLLDFPMASLRQFLVSRNTSWLEDPSNEDLSFDRNYIRHQILPLIEERWPNAALRIARSADYCRQASGMLDSKCEVRLQNHGATGPVIPVKALEPGAGFFSLLLRSWLKAQEVPPMPAGKIIELERQLLESAQDKRPAIEWGGHVLRFFNRKLWLQKVAKPFRCPTLKWEKSGPLHINDSIGTLEFAGPATQPSGEIQVSARRDGDRIVCEQGSRTVKNILREAGVPPWLRDAVPMLRRDADLLAIAGVCVNKQLGSWMRENNVQLLWNPASPVLKEVLDNVPKQAVDHDQGLR